jgi:hypothetical protein
VQIARSAGEIINQGKVDLSAFDGEEIELAESEVGRVTAAASVPAESSPKLQPQMRDEEVTLSVARDRYLAELTARHSLGVKAMNANLTATALLIEVLGADEPLAGITPAMLGRYTHVEQQHYGKGYGPRSLLKAVSAVSYPIDLTGLYLHAGSAAA